MWRSPTFEGRRRAFSIYAAFEEESKGSIAPGKLADIVVLSRDILAVPDEEIPGTVVWATILGGEVLHLRESSGSE
ncbi:MAG: amidohydrolase family protein [Candidatus Eisenbacteria bacterium]|nr:amidohydrolase family protein [Candidatus Eisenbacteria bacterium]